jgi:hypothetical protein
MLLRKVNERWEVFFPSEHKHFCLFLKYPDQWDDNHVKRVAIVAGFWRLFFGIRLWKTTKSSDNSISDRMQYGFTFFDRGIHLHWGKTRVYDLPWAWSYVRGDLLMPDGSLFYRNYNLPKLGDRRTKSYWWGDILEGGESPHAGEIDRSSLVKYIDLRHVTKSGEVQEARIRLAGEEREWRWHWLKWLPFPRKISRTIDCSSDVELGERAGSWKGGMTGWGIDWKVGETMEQAFFRWYSNWDGR